MDIRLHTRNDTQYERVVFAEVIVPEAPNVFGDYWSKEAVKEFAYAYMRTGFIIDVQHDRTDVSGKVKVVESFIARQGDPDFIVGAWVVAMYIGDDDIWQQVLDGDINGYSYEALVLALPAILRVEDTGMRTGSTTSTAIDTHTHDFFVIVGEDERPVEGGTSVTDGHAHTISTHTFTDYTNGHRHRYNLVKGADAA